MFEHPYFRAFTGALFNKKKKQERKSEIHSTELSESFLDFNIRLSPKNCFKNAPLVKNM